MAGESEGEMVRALITGVAGFAGSHLAEHLLDESDWQVAGTVFKQDETVAHLRPRMHLYRVDLRQPEDTRRVIEEAHPDAIFHLAAQSQVASSYGDPWETLENNVSGQLNVLRAVVELCPQARVLVVSSSEVYGQVKEGDLPVVEATPLRPVSPYAVSKIAQEMLGLQHHLSHRLHVVRVRPFNHIGPRQRPGFVAADFARQIAQAEAGLQPPVIEVGNLDTARDFSDVRDIVRAYRLALEHGEAGGVYNIGAERTYTIRQMLDSFLHLACLPIQVQMDPGRMRPSDVPFIVSDCQAFRRLSGWKITIPFEDTLRDVLDYWRVQVAGGYGYNRNELGSETV